MNRFQGTGRRKERADGVDVEREELQETGMSFLRHSRQECHYLHVPSNTARKAIESPACDGMGAAELSLFSSSHIPSLFLLFAAGGDIDDEYGPSSSSERRSDGRYDAAWSHGRGCVSEVCPSPPTLPGTTCDGDRDGSGCKLEGGSAGCPPSSSAWT